MKNSTTSIRLRHFPFMYLDIVTHLDLESGVGAMEADLDLARMASLCLARLAAVLPKMPGLGDLLRVLTTGENVRS